VSGLTALWPFKRKDPYEEFYLNARPTDPRNEIDRRIREAAEGSIFAVRAETHTPEIMSKHIHDLGKFFSADLVRIIDARRLDGLLDGASTPEGEKVDPRELPYAVFVCFGAEHDARDHPGIGGHATVLKGSYATFQMASIIREFGFHATRVSGIDFDRAAATARIGRLNAAGRLDAPGFGTKIHVADVIFTDLPVAPES